MHKADIHKAGGILIRDRKFLVSRSRDKKYFISPGGKLHEGELSEQALVRELSEELNIKVLTADLSFFGTFFAVAAEREETTLQMDVFLVNKWEGSIEPSGEIEELCWTDSRIPQGMAVGSIFAHEVLPRLKQMDLID